MKYQAVIFDMDGVLIDSEIFWDEAGEKFFKKRSIDFNRELKAQLTGQSMIKNMQWVKERYQLPDSVNDLCAEYVMLSNYIYEHVTRPLPGVEMLLQRLKRTGVKIAIGSGSYLSRIEFIVKKFGWEQYFDQLVSSEHVNYAGKPDPAIYIYAAQVLGLLPEHCVVVEDSVNGVNAAKDAGMSCVAALDDRWSYGDFSRADLIVKSLEDKAVLRFLGV